MNNIAHPIGAGQLPGVDIRPVYLIETGTTAATADEIVRHLLASGVKCHRRYDGKLFQVRQPIGVPATHAILRGLLERHCRFERNAKPVDPTAALVASVQASTLWPPASRPVMQEGQR